MAIFRRHEYYEEYLFWCCFAGGPFSGASSVLYGAFTVQGAAEFLIISLPMSLALGALLGFAAYVLLYPALRPIWTLTQRCSMQLGYGELATGLVVTGLVTTLLWALSLAYVADDIPSNFSSSAMWIVFPYLVVHVGKWTAPVVGIYVALKLRSRDFA